MVHVENTVMSQTCFIIFSKKQNKQNKKKNRKQKQTNETGNQQIFHIFESG